MIWLPGQADSVLAEAPGVKVLCNLNHLITAPGWVLLNVTTGYWNYRVLGWIVAANLIGWGIVTASFFAAASVRRSLLSRARESVNVDRRRVLVNVATGLGAGVVGAGLAEAVLLEPWRIKVRRYDLHVRDLPPSLAGFRIVQISDTHLGPRIPARYVRHAVEIAMSLKPDLFALTGDYIHNGASYIEPAAKLFRPLVESGVPVVGTLGNHDWYGDGRAMSGALKGIGVRMIDNARVFVDAGTRELVDSVERGALCIAGFGDLGEDTIEPDRALRDIPIDVPRLILSHNPDSAEEVVVRRTGAPRIDAMLSGHTHGGQICIPGAGTPFLPSRYGQKYSGGICRGPKFPVVVSRGVGMSIFPVRIGVPPEIVVVELRRA